MNINSKNYEEYFLLYADNELTAEERKVVEWFVGANAHLRKEFEYILATVQQPGDEKLEDKSTLFKTPMDEFIGRENLEERLIAYHDDELTDEEKVFVEQFISGHPEVRDEFELLAKARLQPDENVVYPDKDALYRRPASVVKFRFVRTAAAAAMIGGLVWFGYRAVMQDQVEMQPIEVAQSSGEVQNTKAPSGTKQATEPLAQTANEKPGQALTPQSKEDGRDRKLVALKPESPARKTAPRPAETIPPRTVPAIVKAAPPDIESIEESIPEIKSFADREILALEPETKVVATTSAMVHYASVTSEEHPAEYMFYDIPAENIRRSKLGILVKKVKRTIDRGNPINRLLNNDETE